MSYYFGKRSKNNLVTLHSDLQYILKNSIKIIDFTIIDGYRDKERQNLYYLRGVSKLKYPHSEHNGFPSLAADCIPCPFEQHYWNSQLGKTKFENIAEVILNEAEKLNIKMLWGYSAWGWDLPHFQLLSKNGVKYEKNIIENVVNEND